MPTPIDDESVEYNIYIQAIAALKSLSELAKSATTLKERIDLAKKAAREFSQAMGISLSKAASTLGELDATFQTFGSDTKKVWSEVGKGAKRAGQDVDSGFTRAISSVNLLRIALGAFVSMLLFQAIQAVTSFFSEASKQGRQLEETIYRLGNAERSLSLEGVEISLKGLEDGITKIQKLLPIFSREDITQLVGTLAVSTKQLGFTEAEILQLAQSVALLNIQSEKTEDLATTRQHVVSALLASNSKGIAELGVSFNQFAVTQEAVRLGFIEEGETIEGLSDDIKAKIKLSLLHQAANLDDAESLARLNEFLDTNTAKIQSNSAAWKDLLTSIGQGINNLIPNLVPAMEKLQKAVELGGLSKLFKGAAPDIGSGKSSWMDVSIWFKLGTGIKLTTKEYERLKSVLSELSDEEILKIFPDPSAIKDRFTRELVQSLVTIEDTATDTQKALELEPTVDLEALGKLEEKLQDIKTDADNAREDLETNLSQKKSDLDTEYDRKAVDAANDLQRKIVDINKDAEREKAKLRDKQREDDLKAEQDHQNKLWELRMRYLMDLEDALHARDARQVIRLQKQFAIDKEALERKKGLDDKQREDDQRNQLEDIEIKRQERLADAQVEYQQKLADQQLAKQRELDDLNTWYAREQADLELNVERRVKAVVDGWIQEFGATEAGASAIYALLLKYFGPGGMTDAIYAYMRQSMMSSMVLPASMSGAPAPYWELAANQANASSGGSSASVQQNKVNRFRGKERGMAEGGTLLATRPTTVTFGEAGMEMATFTPMSRAGRNTGRVFGSGGANGGLNGQITLDVMLSPDLEARIVENSMEGVADVILKVTNSK